MEPVINPLCTLGASCVSSDLLQVGCGVSLHCVAMLTERPLTRPWHPGTYQPACDEEVRRNVAWLTSQGTERNAWRVWN